MNQWQYKIISIEIGTNREIKIEQEVEKFKEVENILNREGKQGWELTSTMPRYTDFPLLPLNGRTALIHLFLKKKVE